MPIEQVTPDESIINYIDKRVEDMKNAIIYKLSSIGEKVTNEAVNNGTYKDQTRNLRGSVGYVIIIDGIIQFQKSSDVSTKDGIIQSEKLLQKLKAQFSQGIVLIVVAGMNYATYVSAKGYNVLESSELLANKLVPKMLKDLGFK